MEAVLSSVFFCSLAGSSPLKEITALKNIEIYFLKRGLNLFKLKEMPKKVVLMAVSSSGGHIYPALAVAEKLSASLKDSLEIHFVYPPTPLAEKILNSSPYPRHSLSLGGMAKGQKFFRKFKTLLQLPLAFLKSLFLIQKIKPDLILGTGGSVTAPLLSAGFLLRKKRAVWEGNTQLGLANRFLSAFIQPVFTAFPNVEGLNPKKQVWSAYPLRKGLNSESHQSSTSKESFPDDKFKVLILGGSQGSVFFNQVVSQAMEEKDWRKGLFIYHQTGQRSFEGVREKYKALKDVSVFPFTKNIRAYYKNCDLIFSRAGAGSIWESAYFSKSLVLIPLTHSAGGHQLKNAENLFQADCVDLLLEKDFNSQSFKEKVLELKDKPTKRKRLGENLNQTQKKEDKMLEWIKENLS